MGIEIERRFLVNPSDLSLEGVKGHPMSQGYLATGAVNLRIRLTEVEAFLTIKSTGAGLARMEYEYPIPQKDAGELLARPELLGKLAKTRYPLARGDLVFEVDVFEGPLAGLVIAEVELPSVDTPLDLPEWAGEEISHLREYSNESLARFGLPEGFNLVKPR